ASATRARSPPLSAENGRAAKGVTSVAAIAAATAASSSPGAEPVQGARPTRTTSATVNGKDSEADWGRTARRRASSGADQAAAGRPWIRTVPAVGARSAARALNRVDLPAPLGPT